MHTSASQFAAWLGMASALAVGDGMANEGRKALSTEQRSAIAARLPKLTPVSQPAPRDLFEARAASSDSDVLVLPKVTVETTRLKKEELLTLKGKVDEYLDSYLGSKAGLDRGLLNKKTLAKSDGQVAYSFFAATTNEERALEARFDDQRLRHHDDLLATVNVLAIADPEKAQWLRRQASDLFNRKPDIRRDHKKR